MDPQVTIEEVDRIVSACGTQRGALIPILHALQRRYRYLPEPALRRICETTEITPAALDGVASFFPQFRTHPAGRHTISVCDGTACHLKGAPAVYDAIAAALGLGAGEDTDAGRMFTLQRVRCLGCCTLAPAVQIDSVTYGHVTVEGALHVLHDFCEQAERAKQARAAETQPESPEGPEIRIGLGSCCVAGGSERIRQALEETRARFGLNVRIKHVSCVGMCHQTPLMEIVSPGAPPHTYAKVRAEDVQSLVLAHFSPARPVSRMRAAAAEWLERRYTDEGAGATQRYAINPASAAVADFLGVQRHIATESCGEMDPTDLAEYIRRGGFAALRRCLPDAPETRATLGPSDILAEIERAGLRGRGGAGFPTGRKWRAVKDAAGSGKYIICNGDEGDPGAFMDRMILESYAYRVIEGMLIASLAVGAHRGVFYIRGEYPLAVERVRAAIRRCETAGILGERVLGSGHAFRAEVREGAGAFVCGEETALIASLEGARPSPRYRPPFPAEEGLEGFPTLVNNVETLALVPWIIANGADAFSALGVEGSRGTKVFALAGKLRRGGLIEVPMGVTVRQIVSSIGGGVPEGRTFKAVQVGGPSGGCLPARLADLSVDYESLASAGAMMGSGGFIVMDDTDCIVEMTTYFLSFTQLESCGKCVPCRVGTAQMLEILLRLCRGSAAKDDLDRLARLAEAVKKLSLCGLGRTAPNPVLTGLAHFREEFEAHAAGRCPAHRCKTLIVYAITDECIGCTKCAQRCPSGAITAAPYEIHRIDKTKCVRCNACFEVCPVHAVKVE